MTNASTCAIIISAGEGRDRTHLDEATTVETIPTHIKSSVLAESKSAQRFFKKNKKSLKNLLTNQSACGIIISESKERGNQNVRLRNLCRGL